MENCTDAASATACRGSRDSMRAWSSDESGERRAAIASAASPSPRRRSSPASMSWRRRSAISPTSRIRALDTLAGADLVACEDTRVTRGCSTATASTRRSPPITSTAAPAAHRRLLDALAEGQSVALVSDAGTPLVSDPGAALVADAIAAGHRVVPIPGASSLAAALSAAGLPTDEVLFLGFLPSKARRAKAPTLEVARRSPRRWSSSNRPTASRALLADAAADARRGAPGGASAASSPRSTRRSTAARWPSSRRAMPSAT